MGEHHEKNDPLKITKSSPVNKISPESIRGSERSAYRDAAENRIHGRYVHALSSHSKTWYDFFKKKWKIGGIRRTFFFTDLSFYRLEN